MSTIETDSEVATRLEFEQEQRSEGWRLLRAMLKVQRRNLLIGGQVAASLVLLLVGAVIMLSGVKRA